MLPDNIYLKILWQIACGLCDIHKAGVIHRDIKPNNIRVDGEGVVKIIDFGLSRSDGFDAKTRSVIGTPVFMAPELWGSATISFSNAIDTYAFGVTALALLSSVPPTGLDKQPPLPVARTLLTPIFANLPSQVADMISNCLHPNPASRPAMEAVQKFFGKYLLHDQHRALVVMNGKQHSLSKNSRKITLTAQGVGSAVIEYNGMDFVVSSTSGNVFVNNTPISSGFIMPGCCVITFGAGSVRRFVTFDVSNPEPMP